MRGHLAVAVLNYFIGVAISTAMLKYIVDNHIVATVCSTAATFLFGFVLLDRFVYKMNNGGKDR
jgi:putative flippase GtrA